MARGVVGADAQKTDHAAKVSGWAISQVLGDDVRYVGHGAIQKFKIGWLCACQSLCCHFYHLRLPKTPQYIPNHLCPVFRFWQLFFNSQLFIARELDMPIFLN